MYNIKSRSSDIELGSRCMEILIREVGPVDAERFVSYINRENFNYTDWQQDLFAGESIEEIAAKARVAGDMLRKSISSIPNNFQTETLLQT